MGLPRLLQVLRAFSSAPTDSRKWRQGQEASLFETLLPSDVLSAIHMLEQAPPLHSQSRAENRGDCPKVGQSVHTIGQSDGLFRRPEGASVSSCPTMGHSGDNSRRPQDNFGKFHATDDRSGGAESLKCPISGKPARADGEMY